MSDTSQLIRFLKDREIQSLSNTSAEERQNTFKDLRELTKTDLTSLMDAVLILDPEARREFNFKMEDWSAKKGLRFAPINYTAMATDLRAADIIDDNVFQRSTAAIDTITTPGFAPAVQTTVADFILRTVGQLGNVWGEVKKIDLRNRGNYRVMVNNSNGQSQWRTSQTANYSSANSEIEDANSFIDLVPLSFGKLLKTTLQFENVLSGNFLADVIQMLSEQHTRAKDNAVLNGSGVNQPTGMNLNALSGVLGNTTGTQFKLGGSLVESVLNASARISGLRKVGKNKQVIFMNSTFESNILAERLQLTNDDTANLITVKDGSVVKIGGIRIVLNDEVITNDVNNNSVATLAVPEFYIWGSTLPDKMAEDRSNGFDASVMTSKIEGIADGKPGFTNAFAKINSNNN